MISVVKDRLVCITEILCTDDFVQKVSVVSDYLPNVTSDSARFCTHRAIYMYMYLSMGPQ